MTTPDDKIAFNFEGRVIRVLRGTTVAGAILSEGTRVLSRGVKYHRPRGYMCGFSACGNCPLNVNGQPGVVSCVHEVQEGDVVRRELGLPSASFDVLRAADILRKWLPAGFQFKLFAKQPRLSRIAGRTLARLAGGGKFPSPEAIEAARVTTVHRVAIDVLVIGGGVSGLQAAATAATVGRAVILVDQSGNGGRSGVKTDPVIGTNGSVAPAAAHVGELSSVVRSHSSITSVRGVAIGLIDGIVVVDAGVTRWEITPSHLILATGTYETAPLFVNNDRPGVLLADGAVKLRVETGRPLGRRVIVATDSDRGHQVAERLLQLGENVIGILDSRPHPPVEPGRIEANAVLSRVDGWTKICAVRFTKAGIGFHLRADTLVLAFARRPADELILHAEYALAGIQRERAMTVSVVGSASGRATDLQDVTDTVRSIVRSEGGEGTGTQ